MSKTKVATYKKLNEGIHKLDKKVKMDKSTKKVTKRMTRSQKLAKFRKDQEDEETRLARERAMFRFNEELQAMDEGSLELPGFLKAIAPKLTKQILEVMGTTKDEKLTARLAQDLLDRAGYGKIQKGAILHQGSVDVNTTKLELVNMVMSLGRKAGVKVEQESYTQGDHDVIEAEVTDDRKPPSK